MAEPSPRAMGAVTRWLAAATWAIEAQHGACAAFCLMFALCLQRPSFANARCVTYMRPRVWRVTTSYGTSTQKVSLFEDGAIESILMVICDTDNSEAPVYPKIPCRSTDADVWAHSFASRRHHRGKKNFAAFVSDFGIGPLQSPMDVYKRGLGTFWSAFLIRDADSSELLASQLGRQRAPWSQPVVQHNGSEDGELSIIGGDTYVIRRIS